MVLEGGEGFGVLASIPVFLGTSKDVTLHAFSGAVKFGVGAWVVPVAIGEGSGAVA
jgi:hypothetical protein